MDPSLLEKEKKYVIRLAMYILAIKIANMHAERRKSKANGASAEEIERLEFDAETYEISRKSAFGDVKVSYRKLKNSRRKHKVGLFRRSIKYLSHFVKMDTVELFSNIMLMHDEYYRVFADDDDPVL